MGIIKSLCDTDLYGLTMQMAVLHQFPEAEVEYEFKCRNEGIDLSPYINEIKKEITHLCSLRFTEEELSYLSTLKYLKNDYIDFLRIFQLNEKFVQIQANPFKLTIKGPMLHTIPFEVAVLAIINEVYFNQYASPSKIKKSDLLLESKINLIKSNINSNTIFNTFKLADFGTRRRFSKYLQERVIRTLKKEIPSNFVGTSNVLFAMRNGVTPIGTMAHQWFQVCQGLDCQLANSQKFALQKWADEYRGDLGIALSDIVGIDAFLRDFDLYFSKLFDGARHDSGDPYDWCNKLIDHYHSMGIDPKTKVAVFSDGLTVPKALAIHKTFSREIKCSFGIGTNLTNDVGLTPLQIVIKMTKCNGKPVAKLSDSVGKLMCNDHLYLAYLKSAFHIKV